MTRCLLLRHFGVPPEIVKRPVPEPGPGETLVEVHAAAVGHLDLNIVDGRFGMLPSLPFVPGTEASGVVLASQAHPVGAPVRVRGAGVGLRRNGGWAEHAVVPDRAVVRTPDGVDPALTCCFSTPVGTAFAAVHDVAGVRPGERVLVTGAAGAVGALVVQLAARAGAEVVGVVGREAKLGFVPAQAKPLLAREMSRESIGGPVDVLVDTVGGAVLAAALRLVRPRGRAALVGYTAGRDLALDLADFLLAEVALLPVNLFSRGAGLGQVADGLLADIVAGQLTLPVERYAMAQLAEAVHRMRTGAAVGKVVLEPRR